MEPVCSKSLGVLLQAALAFFRARLHRSMWAIRRTRILPVCRATKRPRRSRLPDGPQVRRVSLTQGQTASHKSPYTPSPRCDGLRGGGRGHLRPYAKVGTLMERVRHFCWLGGWSGDLGRENPSERRRRDHGSDGRARPGRRAARGRPGGVVGWPKRRPARGPLGVPRVVLRVSSGRSRPRDAPAPGN